VHCVFTHLIRDLSSKNPHVDEDAERKKKQDAEHDVALSRSASSVSSATGTPAHSFFQHILYVHTHTVACTHKHTLHTPHTTKSSRISASGKSQTLSRASASKGNTHPHTLSLSHTNTYTFSRASASKRNIYIYVYAHTHTPPHTHTYTIMCTHTYTCKQKASQDRGRQKSLSRSQKSRLPAHPSIGTRKPRLATKIAGVTSR